MLHTLQDLCLKFDLKSSNPDLIYVIFLKTNHNHILLYPSKSLFSHPTFNTINV